MRPSQATSFGPQKPFWIGARSIKCQRCMRSSSGLTVARVVDAKQHDCQDDMKETESKVDSVNSCVAKAFLAGAVDDDVIEQDLLQSLENIRLAIMYALLAYRCDGSGCPASVMIAPIRALRIARTGLLVDLLTVR